MRQCLKFLVLLITLSIAVSGASASNVNGIVISVGTTIFDDSLDPIKGAMSYGYPFTNAALLKIAPNSEYIGDMATAWSVSNDALMYSFTLREGVQFSDGSDFTADDVVFTYETAKANQAFNENVDLTRMASVLAVGTHTVEFTLSEPYSPFLDTTAMLGIVPKDSYDSTVFDRYPVGTGPWRVIQYDASQQIIVEPNPYYHEGAPSIPRVTLVYMDSEVALAAAKSGQLDVVMVDPDVAHQIVSGMSMYLLDTMDIRMMSFPTIPEQTMRGPDGNNIVVGNDVTSDVNVREALSIGINRQKIIQNAFNGVGAPAFGFTDNLIWAFTERSSDSRKEEARTILEEAGWVLGSDGIREKDGLRCEFDLLTTDMSRFMLASAVAEDATELGIKMNVRRTNWDEVGRLKHTTPVVWGWGQYSPTVLQNLFYSDLFLKDSYANVGGYHNPQVDEFVDRAIDSNTQAGAIGMWKEAQRVANNDYPYLYIVNIKHPYFISNGLDISVDTQIPHPHGHGSPIICNMKDWTLQ